MAWIVKPSEHEEQKALIDWANMRSATLLELELLFAIANGGERNLLVAKKLKAEGVKAGVPDLMLPVARGGYHGLFIEMKRMKGGRVTKQQTEWLNRLIRQGYSAVVCRGCHDAIQTIEDYLRG